MNTITALILMGQLGGLTSWLGFGSPERPTYNYTIFNSDIVGYEILVYRTNDDHTPVLVGVHTVLPGDVVHGPAWDGRDAQVFVAGVSTAEYRDMVALASDGATDTVFFEGSGDPLGWRLPVPVDVTPAIGLDQWSIEKSATAHMYFASADYEARDGSGSLHVIDCCNPISTAEARRLGAGAEALHAASSRVRKEAHAAAETLSAIKSMESRQLKSQERYVRLEAFLGGKDVAWMLECEYAGDDQLDFGVPVSNVSPVTFMGDTNPLKNGDLIVSIGNIEVWGSHDIDYYLTGHGTCTQGGIDVPFRMTVIRDGQPVTFWMTCAFNPVAWPLSQATPRNQEQAFLAAAVETYTLSILRRISAAAFPGKGTPQQKVWAQTQHLRQLQQFHPGSYNRGTIAGYLGGPLVAAGKTLVRIGASAGSRAAAKRSAAGRMAAVGIAGEMIEETCYILYLDGSPLRSPDELKSDLVVGLTTAAAASAALDSVSKIVGFGR